MVGIATQLRLPDIQAGPMAPPLPMPSAREDWSEIEWLLSSSEASSKDASRSARSRGKVLILSTAVVLVAGGFAGGFATSPSTQNLCWIACGPSPAIATIAANPAPAAIPVNRTVATREAPPDLAEGRSVAEPRVPTPVATPPKVRAVAEVETQSEAPDAVDMTAPPLHRRHRHHHYGWR